MESQCNTYITKDERSPLSAREKWESGSVSFWAKRREAWQNSFMRVKTMSILCVAFTAVRSEPRWTSVERASVFFTTINKSNRSITYGRTHSSCLQQKFSHLLNYLQVILNFIWRQRPDISEILILIFFNLSPICMQIWIKIQPKK